MIALKYRTLWRRFLAGIVDAVVLLLLDFFLFPTIAFVEESPLLLSVWFTIKNFVPVAYFILMHFRFGQTIGKMATSIRVQKLAGGLLSFRQAVLRDIVPVIATVVGVIPFVLAAFGAERFLKHPTLSVAFLVYYGSLAGWAALEILTALLNRKRRALHDFIAGSEVVRVGVPDDPPLPQEPPRASPEEWWKKYY